MTAKKMQKAIAEACGWTRFTTHVVNDETVQYGHPPNSKLTYETPLLEYTKSLDACANMENALPKEDKGGWTLIDRYLTKLYNIVQDPHICQLSHSWAYATATPTQRCEAFCKVFPSPHDKKKTIWEYETTKVK